MTPLGLCLSTLFGCLLGSFIPVINTEIIVLAAAAAAPADLIIPLIAIAAGAQMVAKCGLYLAGSGLVRLPRGRFTKQIDTALARVKSQQRASSAVLFASASIGFPPFYVMSIACGALNVGFKRFFLIGFVGRTLRFAVLVTLPHILKSAF